MTDDNKHKRAPRPGEWFQVHPYEQREIMLLVDEGKEYLVADNMVQLIREKHPDRFHLLRPTMAFRAVNTDGEDFLWLVPLPVPDDHPAWDGAVDLPGRRTVMTNKTYGGMDRASVVATTIMMIINKAATGLLDPKGLHQHIADCLRDEFAGIERQVVADQNGATTTTSLPSADMGPAAAVPNINRMKFNDAVEAVVDWFRANYEDPAESTPYSSAEGGYQYIWGGPCDAREEIEGALASISKKVADAAVKRIEADGSYEWVPSLSRIVLSCDEA